MFLHTPSATCREDTPPPPVSRNTRVEPRLTDRNQPPPGLCVSMTQRPAPSCPVWSHTNTQWSRVLAWATVESPRSCVSSPRARCPQYRGYLLPKLTPRNPAPVRCPPDKGLVAGDTHCGGGGGCRACMAAHSVHLPHPSCPSQLPLCPPVAHPACAMFKPVHHRSPRSGGQVTTTVCTPRGGVPSLSVLRDTTRGQRPNLGPPVARERTRVDAKATRRRAERCDGGHLPCDSGRASTGWMRAEA